MSDFHFYGTRINLKKIDAPNVRRKSFQIYKLDMGAVIWNNMHSFFLKMPVIYKYHYKIIYGFLLFVQLL